MEIKTLSKRSVKCTASGDNWLTLYKDTDDIRLFYSSKVVVTTNAGVSAIREISNAENEEYLTRKEIAEQEEETPNE